MSGKPGRSGRPSLAPTVEDREAWGDLVAHAIEEEWLPRARAAAWVGLSPRTLERWLQEAREWEGLKPHELVRKGPLAAATVELLRKVEAAEAAKQVAVLRLLRRKKKPSTKDLLSLLARFDAANWAPKYNPKDTPGPGPSSPEKAQAGLLDALRALVPQPDPGGGDGPKDAG